MMGYDRSALYWDKARKSWAMVIDDEEKTTTLFDNDLDRLLKMLINSDL